MKAPLLPPRFSLFLGLFCLTLPPAPSGEERPFGMPQRVKWTTSNVQGAPEPPSPYRLTRAFPDLQFNDPVFIAQEPTSDRWLVAQYGGQIYSFLPQNPAASKALFLDMGRGISAFSFHPKYAENGYVFVFSHLDPHKDAKGQLSRVSRFEVDRTQQPPSVKDGSERIIIEWPAGGHNGGEAVFGPDGYLYISTGDSTGGSDPKATGQGVDDLLSVMMRLDVDRPDAGRAYSIPPDNPFVGMPGARPEIWAHGFRNPWRFSFDPVTGQPWVGDVGQDLWEMIHRVSRGSNHGWSVREGSHPFHPHKPRGPGEFTPPVIEHHHTECRSITGGYFYEGAKFPELRGAYIYGDYEYGKMWALRYDRRAKRVTWRQELADSALKLVSFGLARDGSFYALDYAGGGIYQLQRRPPGPPGPRFPRKLSETGLFSSLREQRPAPGVIPYSVNAQFWSDGAHKERWLALPDDARIEFQEKGAWNFDDGTVTVKSFALEMEAGKPESRRWIETRIVVKQDNQWVGYTYAWDRAQRDATLVDAAGMDRTFPIRDPAAPGGVRRQVWHYPSRNECMFCHSRAAGFVLGLNTAQMNRDQDYGGVRDNQLRALNHVGLFRAPLKQRPDAYSRYPDPFDPRADLTERARTYLAVNCAMCHVADGGGNSLMELGYETPLAKARIVDEPPIHETFGLENARLVAPGAPARSVIHYRVSRRGVGQMPPTSTNLVDEAGARLLADWIAGLAVRPAVGE